MSPVMETFMRTVILSIPKASLLEAAINSHDVKQLTPLLTELRQQTFYHLLYREGGEWKERKRIDRHGNYVSPSSRPNSQIFVERPMSQQGNYSILRSTREISGDAEEVYRDLLIGDMSGPQIRGRARWEKRLSREEVLCTIEGVNNEERIPFVRRLFKNRNNSTFNDGASVILKEWKKMGGVYKGCRTCESSSRPVTCRQRHPAGRARGPSLHEERERLRHLSRPGSPSGGRWRRGLGVGPLPHGGGLLCDLRSECERRTALAAHRQDAVLRARRGASLRLSPHPLRT